MSRKKVIIEVWPPDYENYEEKSVAGGFTCPRCAGRGWLADYSDVKDYRQVECSRCAGTGLLRARVAIAWEADI
jgi:DNA-directed RNA polymerase subunit RPC12/RpoP